MKVLLVGNGGREHALAWKLAASPRVTALYAAPGNPGTAQFADNVPIQPGDFPALEKFIRTAGVEFVVVGPEEPLALGLADRVSAMGVKVFGPSREAARIEGDKWFAKELMRQQAIPTAEARSFTDPAAAEEYIRVRDEPMVIKAAGLAKGKGVVVCRTMDEALEAVGQIMRHKAHGQAGARVVIEEVLKGAECSILAFVDRKNIYVMESAQDHKPVGDGDRGPMTGGMGAYSPAPIVTDEIMRVIEREILVPIVDGLIRDGIEYKGVLYAGLMLTAHGPRVLEFNCRFGDPETQPLMMRLQSDLLEVMLAVADGTLDKIELKWDPRPAVAVVAASGGYPGAYAPGVPITGVVEADAMPDVKVFQAGTKMDGDTLVTDGGRVLAVTALGATVAAAQKRAYAAMAKIHFQGMHYRSDIGSRAIV
ncbi:MAG TPA: phosphoribosylamine--glycine ligase [Tepidisphaeraceae bacterium]|jgi:phosphoribosylamine--glycine ligase|nr:phosphoribosylamine--glycine ligase [Tepidisphaeraceae bacterium]